jgi:chemotaxis protein MotB
MQQRRLIFNKQKETTMKAMKISVLTVSMLAFAGNAGAVDLGSICCDGGYEYRHPSNWEKEQQRIKDELAAAKKQLADRERDIASLRSSSSDALKSAQAELDRSKSRVTDLERQLGDRDQEVAALRTRASDASQLASQLSAANSEKDQLAASLAAAQSQVAVLQAAAGDKDKLAADLAAAQSQVAALQAGAGDKDKLAADLAAAQSQVAALQAGAGDKDKLAADLAAAQSQVAALQAGAADKDKLAAELAAEKQRLADLQKQLADRDRELAGLRGELSAEMAKLKEAQRGIIRALRPEIEQGNITVDLNNERLLINLASSMLFGSGEDQLKPGGTDALKRVGAILKDYPEYKVEVDGHTDNRPIRSSLKKRFPTNKELSEARAANGVTALAEGGVSTGTISSAGYADTKPVAPNTTDEGRQKNRRVEVRVTPKS